MSRRFAIVVDRLHPIEIIIFRFFSALYFLVLFEWTNSVSDSIHFVDVFSFQMQWGSLLHALGNDIVRQLPVTGKRRRTEKRIYRMIRKN